MTPELSKRIVAVLLSSPRIIPVVGLNQDIEIASPHVLDQLGEPTRVRQRPLKIRWLDHRLESGAGRHWSAARSRIEQESYGLVRI